MPNYQFHSPCRLHILPLPSEISENGTTFFGKSEKRLSRESCSSCLSSLAHYLKEASVVQTICILLSPHLYTHRREIISKASPFTCALISLPLTSRAFSTHFPFFAWSSVSPPYQSLHLLHKHVQPSPFPGFPSSYHPPSCFFSKAQERGNSAGCFHFPTIHSLFQSICSNFIFSSKCL